MKYSRRFVNDIQSPEERRFKYELLMNFGATTVQARRWRDFSNGKLEMQVIPFLVGKNAT